MVVRVPRAGARAMLAGQSLREATVPLGRLLARAGAVAAERRGAQVKVVPPRAGRPPSRSVHLLAVPARCRELERRMPAASCYSVSQWCRSFVVVAVAESESKAPSSGGAQQVNSARGEDGMKRSPPAPHSATVDEK